MEGEYMEKLRYDSLYKFIVSIGIAIIILPFILLFGILNDNDSVIIKENEINQLTYTAKEVILLKQNYKYMILSRPIHILIIISIFTIIGLIIIIYGIIQWKNKVQKYEDKSRELSNELLAKQIKGLTNEEKEEKIIEDIGNLENDNKLKNVNNTMQKQQIYKYTNIHGDVYKSIRRQFRNYKIFEEVKLNKESYDCIALSTSKNYLYDYIFEIKYFVNINDIKSKIKKLDSSMLDKEMLYYKNSKRFAKTILIIIVENFSEKDRLENNKTLDDIDEKIIYTDKIIITDLDNIENELSQIRKI